MDRDVHRVAVGQRSQLTAFRVGILALLAVDGVLSAIGGALFLPSYLGAVPCPISAVISGLLNAALVWAAGQATTSIRLAALPLWTWLLTILAMAVPGPGGDIVYGGQGALAYGPFLLLVAGAVPPFWVLLRHRRAP